MKQTLKALARRTGLRRTHLAAARMCCERYVLSTIGRRRTRDIGRILCYHSVGQPAWGVNDVLPADFRRQIELALSAGWRFVPASEIARTGGGPKDLAITFDDGLKSVLTHAAPILASYQIPWSAFVVADWSDGKARWAEDTFLGWREIERLAASGVEIGSHSVSHPDFGSIGRTQTMDELGRSRRTIFERSGLDASTFAIPLGQSRNWSAAAAEMAREAGYQVVYAQAEETRPPDTVPRTFVTRFDGDRIFRALLGGVFDRWEEWL
jgi:peptidoglycan/xylan/chitin deacetylase (PgdA/CDA1 family)